MVCDAFHSSLPQGVCVCSKPLCLWSRPVTHRALMDMYSWRHGGQALPVKERAARPSSPGQLIWLDSWLRDPKYQSSGQPRLKEATITLQQEAATLEKIHRSRPKHRPGFSKSLLRPNAMPRPQVSTPQWVWIGVPPGRVLERKHIVTVLIGHRNRRVEQEPEHVGKEEFWKWVIGFDTLIG